MSEFEWASEDPYKVADDLKAGLESALYELGLEIDVPHTPYVKGFYPDNIKVNKLSYRAIESMDLPLIRTWYRYGQFEPYISLRAEELEPRPLQNPEKEVTTMKSGTTINRKTIKSYFLSQSSDIKDIWSQDLFEFMNENYIGFAPEYYEDIYCANTGVMKSLEDTHINYKNDLWIEAESFLDSSMDLRYELESNPRLSRDTKEHVSEFLYAFEDALTAFEHREEDSKEHLDLLRETRKLYHEYVWKLPAMEISVNNIEGPKEEVGDYNNERRQYLSRFKKSYPNKLNRWEKKVERCELKPSAKTYKSVYGGIPDEIGSLEKAAVNHHHESA